MYSPKSKHAREPIPLTKGVTCSPEAAEAMFRILEGRWKMVILYHLFGGKYQKCPVLRFSELERAIPAISQKMLIQQLRA
jgi:DNA-binding HxlR family transcriptional regulator